MTAAGEIACTMCSSHLLIQMLQCDSSSQTLSLRAFVFICVCVHLHVCLCLCVCVYMCAHAHTCVCLCMLVCVCAYVCICVYVWVSMCAAVHLCSSYAWSGRCSFKQMKLQLRNCAGVGPLENIHAAAQPTSTTALAV